MGKIYKVSFIDMSPMYTGYKPLAEVLAKRKGAVIEQIDLQVPQQDKIYDASERDRFDEWWELFKSTHDDWRYADKEAILFASWMAAQGVDV